MIIEFSPMSHKKVHDKDFPSWVATELSVLRFYQCEIMRALDYDGTLVGVTAARFPKRSKYLNFMFAYTKEQFAGRGHGAELQRIVYTLARKRGYDRVRSLINSWSGLRLQMRLGHTFWGQNVRGEVVVSNPLPLCPSGVLPEGEVPLHVRKVVVGTPRPLDATDIHSIVFGDDDKFRVDRHSVFDRESAIRSIERYVRL